MAALAAPAGSGRARALVRPGTPALIPIRDENPTQIVPVVTYAVLGLAVLVFLWQLSLPERGQKLAAYAFGMVPASLLGEATLSLTDLNLSMPLEASSFFSFFKDSI